MKYIGVGFLVIADIVVAIPRDRRLSRYLYAFYRNIPIKIKKKYEVRLVIDYIKKEFVPTYLENNSNIRNTKDLVSLNLLLESVTDCKNKKEAFNFLVRTSKN